MKKKIWVLIGFLDIAPYTTRKTILLAHTDKDYSVGCVLLEDKSIVANYEEPNINGNHYDKLNVAGGFTWEQGFLVAGYLLQGWIDKAQVRHGVPNAPALTAKFNPHATEPKAFTHLSGERLDDIDNQISQMKMRRLRNSGFYIPIDTILKIAK